VADRDGQRTVGVEDVEMDADPGVAFGGALVLGNGELLVGF
jgi:hypothetical protein